MFSTLILDLCVLLPRRRLTSPPSRSTFFSKQGVGEAVYLHCLTAGAPPGSLTSPAPKWTEGSEKEARRKGYLDVSAFPTLPPSAARSP